MLACRNTIFDNSLIDLIIINWTSTIHTHGKYDYAALFARVCDTIIARAYVYGVFADRPIRLEKSTS